MVPGGGYSAEIHFNKGRLWSRTTMLPGFSKFLKFSDAIFKISTNFKKILHPIHMKLATWILFNSFIHPRFTLNPYCIIKILIFLNPFTIRISARSKWPKLTYDTCCISDDVCGLEHNCLLKYVGNSERSTSASSFFTSYTSTVF